MMPSKSEKNGKADDEVDILEDIDLDCFDKKDTSAKPNKKIQDSIKKLVEKNRKKETQ